MRRWPAVAPVLALGLLAAAGCGERPEVRIARRILDAYRTKARAKPLPPAGVIRLRLSSPPGAGAGQGEIAWDRSRYRETLSCPSWTAARGIQGGKAYVTDEDGVTRVGSEPVLAELTTRSYFWRRGYLFSDLEKAAIGLGPSDERTVSVRLTPRGGNPLLLTFARGGETLLAARSPRLAYEFAAPNRWTDRSRRGPPLSVELRSVGLPSAAMEDVAVGGGAARWTEAAAAGAAFTETPAGIVVAGRIAGRPARLLLDSEADGPLRVARGWTGASRLPYREDALGRELSRAGPVEIAGVTFPTLLLQQVEMIPGGADAAVGAPLFRETVVEIDPGQAKLRLHDPARWAIPAGFWRGLLDDDGNRPVAILRNGAVTLRVLADSGSAPLALAPESAERAGLAPAGAAADLKWGAAPLSVQAVTVESGRFDPDWGDDGRLGFGALRRFHVFFDMSRRWTYLQPIAAP